MPSKMRPVLAIAITGTLVIGAGCARSMMEDSAADTWPAPADELDFWDEIEARGAVTNHDALHGLLLAEDPNAAYGGYEAHVNAAIERRWLSEGAMPPADEIAEIGMIAVAVARMLEIRGGVTMMVLGPSPRYATRELVYMGILPDRSPNQAMTGLEFMDLLRKIDSHRTAQPDFMLASGERGGGGTGVATDGSGGSESPDETTEVSDEEGDE